MMVVFLRRVLLNKIGLLWLGLLGVLVLLLMGEAGLNRSAAKGVVPQEGVGGNRVSCSIPSTLELSEGKAAWPWSKSAFASLLPEDSKIMCIRWGDLDGDGQSEALVLYKEHEGTFEEIKGVVVDRGPSLKVYPLKGSYYLGEGLTDDPVVFKDIDGDYLEEIYINSGTGAHIHLLSVFEWDGEDYSLCGDAGGDIGARLEDVNSDGKEEIIGENGFYNYGREEDYPAVIKRVTAYTWQQGRLCHLQIWLEPRGDAKPPFLHPETAVLSYYSTIDSAVREDKGLWQAYNLLSQGFKSVHPCPSFAARFVTTKRVFVEDLRLVTEGETIASIYVRILVVEIWSGKEVSQRYEGTWLIIWENDDWKLHSADMRKLTD